MLRLVRVGDGPWWEGDQPRVGVRVRVRVRIRGLRGKRPKRPKRQET